MCAAPCGAGRAPRAHLLVRRPPAAAAAYALPCQSPLLSARRPAQMGLAGVRSAWAAGPRAAGRARPRARPQHAAWWGCRLRNWRAPGLADVRYQIACRPGAPLGDRAGAPSPRRQTRVEDNVVPNRSGIERWLERASGRRGGALAGRAPVAPPLHARVWWTAEHRAPAWQAATCWQRCRTPGPVCAVPGGWRFGGGKGCAPRRCVLAPVLAPPPGASKPRVPGARQCTPPPCHHPATLQWPPIRVRAAAREDAPDAARGRAAPTQPRGAAPAAAAHPAPLARAACSCFAWWCPSYTQRHRFTLAGHLVEWSNRL